MDYQKNILSLFRNLLTGETSITVTGQEEEIATIIESDFQLSLNVANLEEGEQEVQIKYSGPENVESISR